MNGAELEQKCLAAADRCLKTKGYISMVDVLMETGRLSRQNYEAWRFRQVPYLERVIESNLSRINTILRAVQRNSVRGGLKASWTAYHSWGKGKRQALRFSKSGDPNLERCYATHYVRPQSGLPKPAQPHSQAPEKQAIGFSSPPTAPRNPPVP